MIVPGGWDSQISTQLALECRKVFSPTHRPPLPPQEIFPVLISFGDWVDPRAIVRPGGSCQWKSPVTPSGIEPANIRFIAQCVINCATVSRVDNWNVGVNYSDRGWKHCSGKTPFSRTFRPLELPQGTRRLPAASVSAPPLCGTGGTEDRATMQATMTVDDISFSLN